MNQMLRYLGPVHWFGRLSIDVQIGKCADVQICRCVDLFIEYNQQVINESLLKTPQAQAAPPLFHLALLFLSH